MLEIEADHQQTILDYFNEACWGAVLKYVPVKDLIRTESTSRRWQEVVLTYLKRVPITICEIKSHKDNNPTICYIKRSSLYNSFETWTKKLGPSVVDTYCTSMRSLAIIIENCPNLVALELNAVQCQAPKQLHRLNLRDNLKFLQRLCLYNCSISDCCVSQFVADKALEGLKLYSCNSLTGLCFESMNLANLKSLDIAMCGRIESEHMLSAFNCLVELQTLTLDNISAESEAFQKIQYGLNKMPKLDMLSLTASEVLRGEVCGEQVSQLTRLKHLQLTYQLFDEDIEAVTRCCQELTTLVLHDCRCMSRRSIKPLWRNTGERLTMLKIAQFYYATDSDIVTLIRRCPRLMELQMSGSGELTPRLPARAARARRAAAPGRELSLDLSFTNLAGNCFLPNKDGPYPEVLRRKYEGLNITFLEDLDLF